ncbi:MAG: mechanosensitive ion channel family protein [Eubacteriales bacterium]|nr:mechanosensitive ion channel family protein [Eubacteriales bacterium]
MSGAGSFYGLLLTAAPTAQDTIQDVEKQLGLVERYLSELPERLLNLGIRTVLALVLFVIGSRIILMIRHFFRKAMERSSSSGEAEQFLDSAIKILLYVVLIFMILQLFGVDAASIATVIGSVGVTVGLAIQGSLSNCIGGILILTLKPFRVGDYIIEATNKNEGVVQQISIFYTKLATYDNQTVLIPNGSLANSSLTNVTDEPERRVDLRVGISYDSDIRQARAVVLKLAEANPLVLKDRDTTVYVDALADSSVTLFIRFWARKEDYWQARYELLESIKYGFDEAGIQIPYNQLDVHLVGKSLGI